MDRLFKYVTKAVYAKLKSNIPAPYILVFILLSKKRPPKHNRKNCSKKVAVISNIQKKLVKTFPPNTVQWYPVAFLYLNG